jgi:protein-disulfide isomerase
MRHFLLTVAGTAALAFGPSGPANAQQNKAVPPVSPQDLVLGAPEAKVTVIEYAALTCPHCAAFENDVFPQIKKDFIDTGKIKFVFRDFPLNQLDIPAFRLARCAGTAREFGFVQILFQSQRNWATAKDPVAELKKIGRLGGIGEAEFDACQADPKLQTAIMASLQGGTDAGVNSTPSFFVNGKLEVGEKTYESFAKLLTDAGA